jgi:hypothetical protein
VSRLRIRGVITALSSSGQTTSWHGVTATILNTMALPILRRYSHTITYHKNHSL